MSDEPKNPKLNKFYFLAAGLLAGSIGTYLLAPSKIKIQEKEKIVIQKVEVIKDQAIRTKKTKVTKPDGTIIEKETFDHTIMENIIAQKAEASREIEKTITNFNNKRLLIYGGVNPLQAHQYNLGMSYNLWGPFDVGASFDGRAFVTVGIRF